jgi:hypothetical protein
MNMECFETINTPLAWVICVSIISVAVLVLTWRVWLKGDGS